MKFIWLLKFVIEPQFYVKIKVFFQVTITMYAEKGKVYVD